MAVAYARTDMTVAEFLVWDDGTDTRYELVDGRVVAMAPPAPYHGAITSAIAMEVGSHLRNRPPCRVYTEIGIRRAADDYTFLVADAAVSCTPVGRGPGALPDPLLIFEVLSPSTRAHDLRAKLLTYRAIPSVREIIFIDSREVYCEAHRRLDDTRWQLDLFADLEAVVGLESIGLTLPLSAFYAGLDMTPETAAEPPLAENAAKE